MKKPNGSREWMVFIFTAVGIIATICFAYQSLTDRVSVSEKSIEKIEGKVEFHDKSIIEMRKDIFYIMDGIDDLREYIGYSIKRRLVYDPNN